MNTICLISNSLSNKLTEEVKEWIVAHSLEMIQLQATDKNAQSVLIKPTRPWQNISDVLQINAMNITHETLTEQFSTVGQQSMTVTLLSCFMTLDTFPALNHLNNYKTICIVSG